MKKFIYLTLLLSLSTYGQQSEELVLRKIALQTCRCVNGSDVSFTSEETLKGCDLLAYNNLNGNEKSQLSFDPSSQDSYAALSLKLLPYRKDYCPQLVTFLENKKKLALFEEQRKKARAERNLEEQIYSQEEETLVSDLISSQQLRISALEKLLDECKKNAGAQKEVVELKTEVTAVVPEKETRKERKAREKREKEALKDQND